MIGGNKTIQLQIGTSEKNTIGESVFSWETVQEITGFIDMMSADSNSSTYLAKIAEATDVFIADYKPIDSRINPDDPNNVRAVVDGKRYDVKYIDDPMQLHKHLEIYLKFTGGQ